MITTEGPVPVTFIFMDHDEYAVVMRAMGFLWTDNPKRHREVMPSDYVLAVARAWESRTP